jgi:hypothetical protein
VIQTFEGTKKHMFFIGKYICYFPANQFTALPLSSAGGLCPLFNHGLGRTAFGGSR